MVTTVGGQDRGIQGVKIKRNLRVKHLLTDGGNTESSSTADLHLIRDEPYCVSREQKLCHVLYVLRSLIGNQIFYLPKDRTDKIPYSDLPTQVASDWGLTSPFPKQRERISCILNSPSASYRSPFGVSLEKLRRCRRKEDRRQKNSVQRNRHTSL